MIFFDTNVIVDILSEDAERKASCQEILINARAQGPVYISDTVYAETSVGMEKQQDLDDALESLGISKIHPNNKSLFMAGKAFKLYRESTQGNKVNVLADFFIGAQAFCEGVPLVTADPNRMKHYFPDLEVIIPTAAPDTAP
jgi:hypothetical protein